MSPVRFDAQVAREFLDELCELARLPSRTTRIVQTGTFPEDLAYAPQADLHLLGMNIEPDFPLMARVSLATSASCLFVADSGRESARA